MYTLSLLPLYLMDCRANKQSVSLNIHRIESCRRRKLWHSKKQPSCHISLASLLTCLVTVKFFLFL